MRATRELTGGRSTLVPLGLGKVRSPRYGQSSHCSLVCQHAGWGRRLKDLFLPWSARNGTSTRGRLLSYSKCGLPCCGIYIDLALTYKETSAAILAFVPELP